MQHSTISACGRMFNLSRSTLLYYDSIGLLRPSDRTPAGYRLYGEQELKRLAQIRLFRDLGIPLKRIGAYLGKRGEGVAPVLLQRLLAINAEIDGLRGQQKAILDLIEQDGALKGAKPFLGRKKELGRQAGITPANYRGIHRLFEKTSPAEHRRFLRHLGFTTTEIRTFLKENGKKS